MEAILGAISRSSQGAVTSRVLLRMMARLRPAISRSLRNLSAAPHAQALSVPRNVYKSPLNALLNELLACPQKNHPCCSGVKWPATVDLACHSARAESQCLVCMIQVFSQQQRSKDNAMNGTQVL